MKTFDINIRVRYGEVDQMGFVYYGNYALYLEQARTEMVRAAGFSYKEMEKMGVMMPVVSLNIEYKRPAKYDDLVCVRTYIKGKPTRKIVFSTEMYNEAGKLLNQSEVKLVFMNTSTGKACTCPAKILESLQQFVIE